MVKTIEIASTVDTLTTANTTQYWQPQGSLSVSTTEADQQIIFRTPGVISNIFVTLFANTVAATSTWRLRKNTANGNGVISVTSSGTGNFEDVTNIDTIAAGDLVAISSAPGAATGVMTADTLGHHFSSTSATDTTCTRLACSKPLSISVTAATRYHTIAGELTDTSTESNAKNRMRKAGTLKNMAVKVKTNTRSTASTFRTRKNAANGALTVTVASSGTGVFEDTANNDTVSAGEDWNYQEVLGTGATAFLLQYIAVDFVSTAGIGMLICTWNTGISYGSNSTGFEAVGGRLADNGNDTGQLMKARAPFQFSELTCNILTNTITASTTCKLQKNQADATQVVTIGASSTGVFSDSTHVDTVAPGDNLSYKTVRGATGTSMGIQQIAMWSTVLLPQTVYVEWEE